MTRHEADRELVLQREVPSEWFASDVRTPETARPAQAAILELVEIFKDVIAGRGNDAGGLLGLLSSLRPMNSV